MIFSSKSITRTPIFWFLFCLVSGFGIFFSFKYFSQAFPIVDLELTMDRQGALKKARELVEHYNLGPQNYNQTASFDVESDVQHYIELEAGGPKAFGEILKEKYYSPYTWTVRHFKEYDATETQLFFTPQGSPYGFIQKIPEHAPGGALSVEQARNIAVTTAQKNWNINFDIYKMVEESQVVTSAGRIDHTFVYERTDKKVGVAPYRLKLVVRGDALMELKLSVKVPESFTRKYQEMRSSNNIIALTATIVMMLLYIFGGCLIGLFFLLRGGWLVWQGAFIWGLVIGAFQAASTINQIPLLWFEYDTAVSLQKFIGLLVVKIIIQFLMYTSIGTFIIMVAESLTRKAFPHKIQLWKLWSAVGGSSIQVLGRTLGGYLILGFDFAFSIGLYYLALKFLGWWSPSEALYNPNTLATYVPWISPIASSLSAGFLEECLFRAIPLAGAALLGNKFGKRPLWIAAAFILQAVVFGAAHANYPAQPAYARLVELLVPSAVFGIMYLLYGLLPAILSHFIFDVVWFSLPIFVSSAPGIWFDKCIIILVCLIPLFILFYRRFKSAKWLELPSNYYNSYWKPSHELVHEDHEKLHEHVEKIQLSKNRILCFALTGLVGLFGWIFFTRFTNDALPLGSTLSKAVSFAQETTAVKGAPWSPLVGVEVPLHDRDQNQHIYIWRTLGALQYKKLLNSYLVPPVWKVRLVRFEGDIVDRAEEYTAFFNDTTSKPVNIRIHHQLPEQRALPSLSVEQAREQALAAIQLLYKVAPHDLKEISAVPTKQPNRVDWVFTFSDLTQSVDQGQARITVEIDGKDVVDTYRSIFVPEEWERIYKDEESFIGLVTTICALLFYVLLIIAVMLVIAFAWSHGGFNVKMFVIISTALFIKSCVQTLNMWPIATITFNTTEPFSHQAWRVINIWLIYALFKSVFYGFLSGLLQGSRFKSPQINNRFPLYIWLGIAFGLFEGGLMALFKWVAPLRNPMWPDLTAVGAYLPFLSEGLTMWAHCLEKTVIALLIYTAVDYVTNGWKKFRWFGVLFITLITIVNIDINEIFPFWLWLAIGTCIGIAISILFIVGIRFARASIPITAALLGSLKMVQLMIFGAYQGVFIGGILAIILMNSFALYWSYQLAYNKNNIKLIK